MEINQHCGDSSESTCVKIRS